MKREHPPIYTSCTLLTVKNIITECHTYEKKRQVVGIPSILLEALNPDNTQQLNQQPFSTCQNYIN